MIYTFGYGQKHKGYYVIIKGKDRESCRDEMISKHGMEWSDAHEFTSLDRLQRAGLRELK